MDLSSILANDASDPSRPIHTPHDPPLVWAKKVRRRGFPRKALSWSESAVFHVEDSHEPDFDATEMAPFREVACHRMDSGDSLSGASTGVAPSDHSSPMSQTPLPSTPSDVSPAQVGLCKEVDAPEDSEPFPVPLFVTAIADGQLSERTPLKERDRLLHIMSKVPKEQQPTIELSCGTVLNMKLRLFASASEDARTVSDYIATHPNQHPAPFVVLAKELPMAAVLEGQALEASDSAAADRLRKQAKTRAVRLLKLALQNPSLGLTVSALRGLEGAWRPAELLEPWVAQATTRCTVKGAPRSVLLFPTRTCPSSSAPSSLPRKRARADDDASAAISPRGAAVGRKGEGVALGGMGAGAHAWLGPMSLRAGASWQVKM